MNVRLVRVDGKDVKVGQPYLLMAIPTPVPPKPGEIPTVGQQKINMNMQPCRLQVYDETQAEWVTVEIARPIEVVGRS